MVRRVIFFVTQIAFIIVFWSITHAQSSIVHPTTENLYLNAPFNNHIISTKSLELFTDVTIKEGLFYRYDNKEYDNKEIVYIGKEYGDEFEMFSRIDDVAIDGQERIYILDGAKQLIRVFDENGNFIQTVGKKGRGPGEFELAGSMAILNDSLLYVSNGYRIEKFQISDKEILFVETVNFNSRYSSFCIIGSKFFALEEVTFQKASNSINIAPIQAFKLPALEKLYSFGRAYQSDNPMVVGRLSSGRLTCNVSENIVLYTNLIFPIIQGFSSIDGTMKWQFYIDGLKHVKVIEKVVGGRLGLLYENPNGKIVERLNRPIHYRDKFELLQIETIERGNSQFDIDKNIKNLILDSSTGNIYLSNFEFDKVLTVSEKKIIFLNEDLTGIIVWDL